MAMCQPSKPHRMALAPPVYSGFRPFHVPWTWPLGNEDHSYTRVYHRVWSSTSFSPASIGCRGRVWVGSAACLYLLPTLPV